MKYDPTKSKTLIRSYENSLKRRISRFWQFVHNPILEAIQSSTYSLKQSSGKMKIDNSAISDIERLLDEYDLRILQNNLKTQIHRYMKQAYEKGSIKACSDVTMLGFPLSFEPYPVDFRALDVLVDNNFSLVKDANAYMKKEMLRHISNGILEGKGIYKIQRDLRKTISLTKTRATMIARTEVIRSYTQGAINQYKKVGIKKFRWICSYDERTCERCSSLDGKVFKVGAEQPPLHVNCRCTIAPIVENIK